MLLGRQSHRNAARQLANSDKCCSMTLQLKLRCSIQMFAAHRPRSCVPSSERSIYPCSRLPGIGYHTNTIFKWTSGPAEIDDGTEGVNVAGLAGSLLFSSCV
jgi:hypothetical protein